MKKIKLLLIALLAMFAVSAYSQEKFTDLSPNYAKDGTTVLFYTQVRQETTGDSHKHIIRFVRNKDCKDLVYVQHIKCNDATLEGWTKLGPTKAQSWVFSYTDDKEDGNWTWEYSIVGKSVQTPDNSTDPGWN